MHFHIVKTECRIGLHKRHDQTSVVRRPPTCSAGRRPTILISLHDDPSNVAVPCTSFSRGRRSDCREKDAGSRAGRWLKADCGTCRFGRPGPIIAWRRIKSRPSWEHDRLLQMICRHIGPADKGGRCAGAYAQGHYNRNGDAELGGTNHDAGVCHPVRLLAVDRWRPLPAHEIGHQRLIPPLLESRPG